MHNVEHAITGLRDASGLTRLQLDRQGNAELVIDRKWNVFLMKVSDSELELVARLSALEGRLTTYALRRLLEWNGSANLTGAGRISIEPGGTRAVYCERVDVLPLDTAGLLARIAAFVGTLDDLAGAAFIASLEAPAPVPVLADDEVDEAEIAPPADFLLKL